MRVLVTGHAGYIGSLMVPVLHAAGHEVVGLDTFFFEDCWLGTDGHPIPARRKDIRDVGPADLEGFDGIVHLAALCDDPSGDLPPEWTHAIDHQASVRLARLAREAGVQRFVYASSWQVYGAAGRDDLLAENAPLHPVSPYAISKVRTEADISKLADHSFSPTFMRSASAYGLSPRLRTDGLLNSMVCWAHTTGRIQVTSHGSTWCAVVHAQDVARAFAAALAAPRDAIHNQPFNVGANGENYQVRELVEIVRSTVPGCTVEYSRPEPLDRSSYRVDFSKVFRTFPDFNPEWNALFGAKDLYATLQEADVTLQDFEGGKYDRLSRIKQLLALGRLDHSLRWTGEQAATPGTIPGRPNGHRR